MKKLIILSLILLLFVPPLYASEGTGIGETYTTYKERTTAPAAPTSTYDRFYFTSTGPKYVNSAGSAISLPNAANVVPYTGATANLDLGNYCLVMGGLTHCSVAASVLNNGTITLPTMTSGWGARCSIESGDDADAGEFSVASSGTASAIYSSAGLVYNEELLTLDVAATPADFAPGATLTGVTSTKTVVVVSKLTALTYIVKNRTGAFTLGEVIGDGTNTADQGAANPVFSAVANKVNVGSAPANPLVITNASGGTLKIWVDCRFK